MRTAALLVTIVQLFIVGCCIDKSEQLYCENCDVGIIYIYMLRKKAAM